MGREIRMVLPNWEHPRYTEDDTSNPKRIGQYRPLYDMDFETSAQEWLESCILWSKCEHPDQKKKTRENYPFYWQWAGEPPDAAYYRPKWADGEATWFQVYETVSEGTPVTPPFATKEEIVEYLSTKGSFWDDTPWDRESAKRFVGDGWAPSGIATAAKGFKTVNEPGFYS